MDNLPDNAIFILVFLAIGAVRWFIERAGNKNQPPPPEHWEEYDYEERADQVTPRGGLQDLYEEARLEILDRQNRQLPDPTDLGGSPLAPPPLPPIAPPKTVAPAAKPAKKEADAPYQLKKVRRPTLTAAEQQALVNLEQMGHQKAPLSESNNRIRKILSDPTSARDAIILSEILGKPKSAQ